MTWIGSSSSIMMHKVHICIQWVLECAQWYAVLTVCSTKGNLLWGFGFYLEFINKTSSHLHTKMFIISIYSHSCRRLRAGSTAAQQPRVKCVASSAHQQPAVETWSLSRSSWEHPITVYVPNHWPFQHDSDGWTRSSACPPLSIAVRHQYGVGNLIWMRTYLAWHSQVCVRGQNTPEWCNLNLRKVKNLEILSSIPMLWN